MNDAKRILLVEDDPSIGVTLKQKLEAEGFTTLKMTNQSQALQCLPLHRWDLFIFDLGLPDGSGLELTKEVKKQFPEVPVILITALNTAENRLSGLELGAHEFIPKPFHFKELLLRIRRTLKEQANQQSRISTPQGVLDIERMCFTTTSGSTTFFTSRDFQVMKLLVLDSPKVVSREKILELIFGSEELPTLRTVDNSITRLRQILQDKEGKLIRSVRGIGYQWLSENKPGDSNE